jgi:hypothetical protein
MKLQKKAVSAIPVGLKCETRCSCSSRLGRDNSIIFIMEEILSQPMMSVTICDRPNVAKVSARAPRGMGWDELSRTVLCGIELSSKVSSYVKWNKTENFSSHPMESHGT